MFLSLLIAAVIFQTGAVIASSLELFQDFLNAPTAHIPDTAQAVSVKCQQALNRANPGSADAVIRPHRQIQVLNGVSDRGNSFLVGLADAEFSQSGSRRSQICGETGRAIAVQLLGSVIQPNNQFLIHVVLSPLIYFVCVYIKANKPASADLLAETLQNMIFNDDTSLVYTNVIPCGLAQRQKKEEVGARVLKHLSALAPEHLEPISVHGLWWS